MRRAYKIASAILSRDAMPLVLESEILHSDDSKSLVLESDEIQTLGKRKAGESLSELEVEEEEEDEEEDDDDEELEAEKEGEAEEEEEEEEPEMCLVCLKDKEHWTDECPYLKRIPNPMEVTLGTGYDLVCKHCNVCVSNTVSWRCKWCTGHPKEGWEGRAIRKICCYCRGVHHWSDECPKKDLLRNRRSLKCFSY